MSETVLNCLHYRLVRDAASGGRRGHAVELVKSAMLLRLRLELHFHVPNLRIFFDRADQDLIFNMERNLKCRSLHDPVKISVRLRKLFLLTRSSKAHHLHQHKVLIRRLLMSDDLRRSSLERVHDGEAKVV